MHACGSLFENREPGLEAVKRALKDEAQKIYKEDIAANKQIGKYGASLLRDAKQIMTHCNAGALATAGYGTALGVIRALKDRAQKFEVFVNETRPFLQGARLTAWELKKEKIAATLITDNMAGYLMQNGQSRCGRRRLRPHRGQWRCSQQDRHVYALPFWRSGTAFRSMSPDRLLPSI